MLDFIDLVAFSNEADANSSSSSTGKSMIIGLDDDDHAKVYSQDIQHSIIKSPRYDKTSLKGHSE